MTVPIEISESVRMAVDSAVAFERRRIVGMVLQAYALAKLAGEHAIADVLDRLATEIEHS